MSYLKLNARETALTATVGESPGQSAGRLTDRENPSPTRSRRT
jgi:hypothetical protein